MSKEAQVDHKGKISLAHFISMRNNYVSFIPLGFTALYNNFQLSVQLLFGFWFMLLQLCFQPQQAAVFMHCTLSDQHKTIVSSCLVNLLLNLMAKEPDICVRNWSRQLHKNGAEELSVCKHVHHKKHLLQLFG